MRRCYHLDGRVKLLGGEGSTVRWETTEVRVLGWLCVILGCSLPLFGPCCWRHCQVSKESGAVEVSPLHWEGHKVGSAIFWPLASPCVVPGNAASTSPWSLLEMQTLGPSPDLLSQDLHFNKVSWWFTCSSKLEKCVNLATHGNSGSFKEFCWDPFSERLILWGWGVLRAPSKLPRWWKVWKPWPSGWCCEGGSHTWINVHNVQPGPETRLTGWGRCMWHHVCMGAGGRGGPQRVVEGCYWDNMAQSMAVELQLNCCHA